MNQLPYGDATHSAVIMLVEGTGGRQADFHSRTALGRCGDVWDPGGSMRRATGQPPLAGMLYLVLCLCSDMQLFVKICGASLGCCDFRDCLREGSTNGPAEGVPVCPRLV